MANITRESLINRVFIDKKNYPYGFSRSGDFSINESKALSQYGALIAALVDGEIEPESEEDHGILLAAFGKKEADTVAEKAWVKYQKRINRPKMASIYGGKPAELVEDENVDDDSDIDEDSELEIGIDD